MMNTFCHWKPTTPALLWLQKKIHHVRSQLQSTRPWVRMKWLYSKRREQPPRCSCHSTLMNRQFPQGLVFSQLCTVQSAGRASFWYRMATLTMSIFSRSAVQYFDSLYTGYLSDGIQQQECTHSTYTTAARQNQLAVEYAVHLAHRQDPTKKRACKHT